MLNRRYNKKRLPESGVCQQAVFHAYLYIKSV